MQAQFHFTATTPPTPTNANKTLRSLSDVNLETLLLSAKTKPMTSGDDRVRLSLAGAQSKLAIIITDEGDYLSAPTHASTHILKPPSSHAPNLVENEFFCMQLATHIGITTPSTCIRTIGKTHVYQTERYDRLQDKTRTARMHQEDFCQALGVVPENKYQSEGGPGLKDSIQLLLNHSTQPAQDYQALIDRVIYNYLIGNNDAHAKNFSLLYNNNQVRLAPPLSTWCAPLFTLALTQKWP